MPSALKAIFSADASEFVSAMKVVETASSRTGNVIATDLRKATAVLQQAAERAREAGQSTRFYDEQVAALTARLNALTAAEAAASAQMDAHAEKRARAVTNRSGSGWAGKEGWLKRNANPDAIGDDAESHADKQAEDARILGRHDELQKKIAASKERMRQGEIGREEQAAARAEYVSARARNMGIYQRLRISKEAGQSEAEAEVSDARAGYVSARAENMGRIQRIRLNKEAAAEAAQTERQALLNSIRYGTAPGLSANRGIGGAASAMFVSVARDSAASLASGANPFTVFMQQAPQVAQAFTMMGTKIPFFGKLLKDTSLASEKLAVTLAQQAGKAAVVAAADGIAANAELALSGATAQSTIAAEAKAAAIMKAAQADQARAEAAAEAAAVERAAVGPAKLALTSVASIALTTVAALALVGIGAWIYFKRVATLTKEIAGWQAPDLVPKDIGRLNSWEIGWRKIRDAIADAVAEINSANRAFATTKTLLDHLQSTEKRQIELRKQAAMDEAGDAPAKRAAVRGRFAKEESELQKRQQDEQMKLKEKHILELEKQQEDATKAARTTQWIDEKGKAHNISTTEQESDTLQALKNNVRAHTKDDPDIAGKMSIEDAQKLFESLTTLAASSLVHPETGENIGVARGLSHTDAERLAGAKDIIYKHQQAKLDLEEFERTKKLRDDARTEQARHFALASQAGADKVKAEKEYNEALALNQQILDADDKLRAMELAGSDAKELKSKSGRGSIGQIEWEKSGGFLGGPQVTLLDETRGMHRELKGIHSILKNPNKRSNPYGN